MDTSDTDPATGGNPPGGGATTDRLKARLFSLGREDHALALKAQGLPPRLAILVMVTGAALLAVLVLGLLVGSGRAGAFWFGRASPVFPYPFSIQVGLHVLFALGLAELYVRSRVARFERVFLSQGLLPEDEETVLQIRDLGALRRKVARSFDGDNGFLPSLIDLAILRLQTSKSVDQAVNVLNASLELFGQRLDLRYQLLRYLVWVVPTIGFIGTVVGIAGALAFVDPETMDLKAVTGSLSVAFDTTVIALMWSAVLVLLQHIVQKDEEMSLNLAGHYCLKNLINRIYIG